MSELKKRFTKKGFSVTSYARAHNVPRCVLDDVLMGILKGIKETPRSGNVRKIIVQLKKDGVYKSRLPWEVT